MAVRRARWHLKFLTVASAGVGGEGASDVELRRCRQCRKPILCTGDAPALLGRCALRGRSGRGLAPLAAHLWARRRGLRRLAEGPAVAKPPAIHLLLVDPSRRCRRARAVVHELAGARELKGQSGDGLDDLCDPLPSVRGQSRAVALERMPEHSEAAEHARVDLCLNDQLAQSTFDGRLATSAERSDRNGRIRASLALLQPAVPLQSEDLDAEQLHQADHALVHFGYAPNARVLHLFIAAEGEIVVLVDKALECLDVHADFLPARGQHRLSDC
mmetsp:Transcript_144691/g.463618  ORF Transcript_144691/g.463618 Transcript_144691/m.463618 type:complete len:273 (-) Transcript_144691:1579-2397(-)